LLAFILPRILSHQMAGMVPVIKPTPLPVDCMYQKPSLEKFGTFRDLTQWGLSNASDGGSIFGIGSPGCTTTIGRTTYTIGCPTDGPSAS